MSKTRPTPAPVYTKAPIIEAVIGVNFASPLSERMLAGAKTRLSRHYDKHDQRSQLNVKLTVNPNTGPQTVHVNTPGHEFSSLSGDERTILMPNMMTVARHAPYNGGDELIARFKRDFKACRGRSKFLEVARIGMRFINRVDIPSEGDAFEFERYLNIFPRMPEGRDMLLDYQMRTTVEAKRFPGLVNIASQPTTAPLLRHASFIIDIDVFKTDDLAINDKNLFELVDIMRQEKNDVFESCITQQAREELFGHANAV